jgi:hypothetical protein
METVAAGVEEVAGAAAAEGAAGACGNERDGWGGARLLIGAMLMVGLLLEGFIGGRSGIVRRDARWLLEALHESLGKGWSRGRPNGYAQFEKRFSFQRKGYS